MSLVPYATRAYTGWQSLSEEDKATLIEARNQIMAYGKRRFVNYVQRAKKRRKVLRTIGRPRNTSNSKRSDQEVDNTGINALNTRTLYSYDLTRIVEDSTRQDARHAPIVNLNGVKLCFQLWNNKTTSVTIDDTLMVNWAIVRPKSINAGPPTSLGGLQLASANKIEQDKFFRSSNGTRGEAFADNRTAMEFHCSPINTDKYDVLSHKRFKLSGAANSFIAQGKGYKTIDQWVPIKRQLTYMDTNSDNPDGNLAIKDDRIFLLVWCDRFTANKGTAFQPDYLNVRGKVIRYFRESRK